MERLLIGAVQALDGHCLTGRVRGQVRRIGEFSGWERMWEKIPRPGLSVGVDTFQLCGLG